MGRTPEGIEKEKVKRFLKQIGAYQFWPVPSGYGQQGVDCYACIEGDFWAIEVKAEGESATVRQEQTLDEVIDARGKSVWGTAAKILDRIHHVLRDKD